MFVPKNNNSILWFNKYNMEMPIKYELIGMILGLALYNQGINKEIISVFGSLISISCI